MTIGVIGTHEHRILLKRLKRAARPPTRGFPIQKYLGTTHNVLNVSVPDRRRIAHSWAKTHQSIDTKNLVTLIDALCFGDSHEEKGIAPMLLARFPDVLTQLSFRDVNRWIGALSGWAEVDSFCDELAIWLLADVTRRLPVLKKWAGDTQIEKRRASLVVLCCAVRVSSEKKLVYLSFELINRLKSEKGIMITKAISWLLRSLLKYHRAIVIEFLKKENASLPAIAVRETTKKLETGKK